MKKYDVFVFELCEGNISKESSNGFAGSRLELSESISICDQLLDGLVQLEECNVCHNDLKPENILFNCDQNGELHIKIGDFGQAGRTGGTPGWTWPKFLSERKPGKSDAYSVGLLLLYVICDDSEIFHQIRNNYVENRGQQWLTNFRNDPFIKLVSDMMNLKLAPKEARLRWNTIFGQVQIITRYNLWQNFGVDSFWLRSQDGMDTLQQSSSVQNQGENELCWLYSITNVIVSSLWVRLGMFCYHISSSMLFLGEVPDTELKQTATELLNRKDLRQKIRRELLFGLFPKTLKG